MNPRFVLLALTLSVLAGIPGAYVTSLHAPAVILNQSIGELTGISLNVTPGTGSVVVNGASSVGSDTRISAETAATYASAYLGIDERNYNFTYTINASGINVSGPSAGLAFTLLAVYGLQGKQLPSNFSVTGTIEADGAVGLVGGVYDKATAVKKGNLGYLIVPFANNGSIEYLIYYMAQQQLAIPIEQAGNVTQALNYVSGNTPITHLQYSILRNYSVASLPTVNSTCNGCNLSAFWAVTDYTLNFTAQQAASLYQNKTPNAFIRTGSNLQSQLLTQLDQYRAIASKGYLYTAADLAFLDYIKSFVFANSYNITGSKAVSTISSVSLYCSSLTPPAITQQNYEYVMGGELRQSWANITLHDLNNTVNSSSDSDAAIEAIYSVAPAYAWCKAANEMYSVAASLNGTNVSISPSLKRQAYAALSNMSSSDTLYSRAAKQLYANGYYGAALYSAVYANVFSGSQPTIAFNASTVNSINSSISNETAYSVGVWPYQFALQSSFYLKQAMFSSNSNERNSDMRSSYSSLMLSQGISAANNKMLSSMTYSATQPSGTSQLDSELASLQHQFNKIYELSLVIMLLLLLVIISQTFFIAMLLKKLRNGKKR
ncbi:MAG: hypothetical protein KGI00_04885 [Candidatus Micrarchaeota archaeon]|nr:hypothetical protein [Candidatus Micrarchaeota archaeon]MDE1850035.1 hypothetical protein [Candidatus Micrarchaeota archaeon]